MKMAIYSGSPEHEIVASIDPVTSRCFIGVFKGVSSLLAHLYNMSNIDV